MRSRASLLFVFNISGFLIFFFTLGILIKMAFRMPRCTMSGFQVVVFCLARGSRRGKKCIRLRICNSFDEMSPYEIQASGADFFRPAPLQIKYSTAGVCVWNFFVLFCGFLIEKCAMRGDRINGVLLELKFSQCTHTIYVVYLRTVDR